MFATIDGDHRGARKLNTDTGVSTLAINDIVFFIPLQCQSITGRDKRWML